MSSTPNPNPSSGSGEEGARDAAVAKIAGFVVFSGIALSIIKTLTLPKAHLQSTPSPPPPPLPPPPPSPPLNDCSQKHPPAGEGLGSSARTVEIVKGDTLWGFARKYGVSIDAIKEANGLAGDKIYAGKKLFIPSK